MNELTPYEQLIAAKLDQVAIPDMADGIWSNIEMQLDAPADGPDAPAQKPAATLKGIGWYGLAVTLAVVSLLWWYFSHKPVTNTTPSKALPETQTPLPVVPPPVENSHASDRPPRKVNVPIKPVETPKDTASFHNIPKDSVRVDSAANKAVPSMKIDSSSLQRNRPGLPDVDLYGSPPPLPRDKKHKGVKGITDDDYKIKASKDSGRKP